MYTDFGYMEEGKLGKPYDLKLMARLGKFLKPYWTLMGLSLLFVLMMAGLDLFIPYLTKEAIDRYIVVAAREVVLKERNSSEEHRFRSQYDPVLIPKREKGKFLIPPHALRGMDRKEMALFQKSGLLTENRYYLFVPQKQEEEGILKRYPSSFEKSGSHWFISIDRMKELEKEDLFILRGRDVEGVFRIALLVVSILIINFGISFAQVYAMEVAGQRMMHDLRMKVFSHLQDLF